MPTTIGILGAGIAGLTLARRLLGRGLRPILLDKGRRPGGRASTRSAGAFAFDHGPPWFEVADPAFRAFLNEAMPAGTIAPWAGRFGRLDAGGLVPEVPPSVRLVGVPGMGAIGAALAGPVDVRQGIHVCSIEPTAGGWLARDRDGDAFGPFDWVVATAPPPQTAALLRGHSGIAERAEAVSMDPCFALMIAPDGGDCFPFDGIRCDHPALSWASNEHAKPGRSPRPALVLHSSTSWAEARLDHDPAEVALALKRSAEEALAVRIGPATVETVHRWRFARPARPLGQPCLIDPDRRLAACGDWCLGGSIEGAFLSGEACARALLDAIGP